MQLAEQTLSVNWRGGGSTMRRGSISLEAPLKACSVHQGMLQLLPFSMASGTVDTVPFSYPFSSDSPEALAGLSVGFKNRIA